MTAFVGIDLAWFTKERTGLAVVDQTGRLIVSTAVVSDDEIDAWLAEHAPTPRVVAVDAPLVVRNSTGQRPCETLIGQAFGRYDASCHSSNTSKAQFAPPRGSVLAGRHGWSMDPADDPSDARPVCIEVYPHAAMVGLFLLGRTFKYKKKFSFERRQPEFIRLLDSMEGIPELALIRSRRWAEIRADIEGAKTGRKLRLCEDEVDAILCAHLAWLWSERPDTLEVYGDLTTGYIVAPPKPHHAPTPRLATARATQTPDQRRPA